LIRLPRPIPELSRCDVAAQAESRGEVEVAIAGVPVQPKASLPSRIAVVGNYLPRLCGIATFTTDLCDTLSAEYGTARLFAVPVNDTESGYSYPARVRWTLAQDDLRSYQDAAEFLNFNNIDMVCLQHEYGIFGGHLHFASIARFEDAGRDDPAHGPARAETIPRLPAPSSGITFGPIASPECLLLSGAGISQSQN
jgi:hypothetical protein